MKLYFGAIGFQTFDVHSINSPSLSFPRDYTDSSTGDKNHHKNNWQLITLYLDSAQDVFEHKNKQDLSENKLLGQFLHSVGNFVNKTRRIRIITAALLKTRRQFFDLLPSFFFPQKRKFL